MQPKIGRKRAAVSDVSLRPGKAGLMMAAPAIAAVIFSFAVSNKLESMSQALILLSAITASLILDC